MKYRLIDICSITKGATGIMKADGGKYPLVALGEERRNHSEFQFDAKAVIVPLISSTGHGHASMKRVHYQEGKFALGNILCAVIPKDETQLHPKYLHLYLQQFKNSLLVPLMKGAANVSLPMNKLADVEIEVPSLERQLEIIALAEEAAEYKNELEERLIAQDSDVAKLRQAFLKEAFRGRLAPQSTEIVDRMQLLNEIEENKIKLTNLRKYKPLIASERLEIKSMIYDLPVSWQWFRLGEVAFFQEGPGIRTWQFTKTGIKLLNVHNILKDDTVDYLNSDKYISEREFNEKYKHFQIESGDIIWASSGASWGKIAWHKDPGFTIMLNTSTVRLKFYSPKLYDPYLYYFLKTDFFKNQMTPQLMGLQPNFGATHLSRTYIPIPPFSEQINIVKRIEEIMQLCDELQYSIQQSKIENEKLLQGALRDALKK